MLQQFASPRVPLRHLANEPPAGSEQAKIKLQGIEMARKGLMLIDNQLEGKTWLVGDYSIADCALFFFEFWSKRVNWQLPPNVETHFARMNERPAVQKMLSMEGLA